MKCIHILFVLVLLARATVGQVPATDSLAGAELIFYRAFIPKLDAPLKKISIYINDHLVHELKFNTIFRKTIFPPAKTLIAIDKAGETETVFYPQAGARYYFKCEMLIGFWFGKPAFHLVSSDLGESECQVLERKGAKKK